MSTSFNPIIEFFHLKNGSLSVLFDPSGSSPEREAQIIEIPNSAEQYKNDEYPPCMSIQAKNFSESILGKKKIFICEIYLVKDNSREYLIGHYQEIIESRTHGFFKRYNTFTKTLIDFEKQIKQKLANEFSYAWQNYILRNNNTITTDLNKSSFINRKRHTDSDKKFNNLLLACILVPLFILILSWAFVSKRQENDPVKQAVLEAMKTNPQLVQSQVETTKQTLKDMGLDPGKYGDVGCLVSPQ